MCAFFSWLSCPQSIFSHVPVPGFSSPGFPITNVSPALFSANWNGQVPDQVNILLPRSLAGKGDVDVMLTIEDQTTKPVTIEIR